MASSVNSQIMFTRLKDMLVEIHERKGKTDAHLGAHLDTAKNFFDVIVLAGEDYFYQELVAEKPMRDENDPLQFLYFAKIVVSYIKSPHTSLVLNDIINTCKTDFDPLTIKEYCKAMMSAIPDNVAIYCELASIIPDSIITSAKINSRIETIDTAGSIASMREKVRALLTLSFLPEDREIGLKLHLISKAHFHVYQLPSFITSALQELDEEFKDKSEVDKKIFADYSMEVYKVGSELHQSKLVNFNDYERASKKVQKKIDPEHPALMQINTALYDLVRYNKEKKEKLPRWQTGRLEVLNQTEKFRQNIERYAPIYLSLTDETDKTNFKEFITILYSIDKKLTKGEPVDFDDFSIAFEKFQKIVDPRFHSLDNSEVNSNKNKLLLHKFLAALTVTALVCTIFVSLPYGGLAFVALAATMALLHKYLYTNPHEELKKNEESASKEIFIDNYRDRILSFFPAPPKDLETEPRASASDLELGV